MAAGIAHTVALAASTARGSADLRVAVTSSRSTLRVPDRLAYEITVKNKGPDPASTLTLVDAIAPNARLVSVIPHGWSCTTPSVGATGDVVCTRARLAPGAATTVRLTVRVVHGGGTSMTDTATVSAVTADPVHANNSASVTVSFRGRR